MNSIKFNQCLGQHLISVRGACPKEVVQPKCDELSRVCDMVSERLSRRLEILAKSRDLMERVEKVCNLCAPKRLKIGNHWLMWYFCVLYLQANAWCARGIELLASQHIEKCSASAEYTEESLQELQRFVMSASEFCTTSSPNELRNVFQESATPETKALVTQVNERTLFNHIFRAKDLNQSCNDYLSLQLN